MSFEKSIICIMDQILHADGLVKNHVEAQRMRFATDRTLKMLSEGAEIKFVIGADDDHPLEYRQQEFLRQVQSGAFDIVTIPDGINISVRRNSTGGFVDMDSDIFKVFFSTSMILNGVYIKFSGWLNKRSLTGQATAYFDEQNAFATPMMASNMYINKQVKAGECQSFGNNPAYMRSEPTSDELQFCREHMHRNIRFQESDSVHHYLNTAGIAPLIYASSSADCARLCFFTRDCLTAVYNPLPFRHTRLYERKRSNGEIGTCQLYNEVDPVVAGTAALVEGLAEGKVELFGIYCSVPGRRPSKLLYPR